MMFTFKNIFTTVIIATIFSLHPSLNKGPISYLHYIVYGNDINLNLSEIDLHQISVKWSCENFESDCKELVIYKNGEKINDIPFEKGLQQIAVYYNNKLIGTLQQNKEYKNQAHQYTFFISSDEENIKFKGEISGPAPSEFSQTISKKDIILAQL